MRSIKNKNVIDSKKKNNNMEFKIAFTIVERDEDIYDSDTKWNITNRILPVKRLYCS